MTAGRGYVVNSRKKDDSDHRNNVVRQTVKYVEQQLVAVFRARLSIVPVVPC